MDFAHCNKCLRFPENSENIRFRLATCKHIFCGKCFQGNNKKCPICNKSGKTIEVSTEASSYFDDIIKTGQKLQETVKFQYEQINNFLNPKCMLFEKIKQVKLENQKLKQTFSHLQKEIERQRRESQQLEERIAQRKRSDQYGFWKRDSEPLLPPRNDRRYVPNKSTPSSNFDHGFYELSNTNNTLNSRSSDSGSEFGNRTRYDPRYQRDNSVHQRRATNDESFARARFDQFS